MISPYENLEDIFADHEGGSLYLFNVRRTHKLAFVNRRSRDVIETFKVDEFETNKEVIDRVFNQKDGHLRTARLLRDGWRNGIFWNCRPSVELNHHGEILGVIEIPLIIKD